MKRRLLALLLITCFAFADSSGPRTGTGAGSGWTTPNNVGASDNAYASESIGAGSTSDTHTVTSLGFAIPSGTVVGIAVDYEHKCSSGPSQCSTSTADGGSILLTGCTGTSANRGDGISWTNADTTNTLGSSSDMWGLACSVAQINAGAFGVSSIIANVTIGSRTASLDYIAVTVYYTPSASTGMGKRQVRSQTRTISQRRAA